MTSIADELDDLGSVLDVIQQPIWAVDAGHRVFYANPSAARTLGHDRPAELLGTDGRPGGVPDAPDDAPDDGPDVPSRATGPAARALRGEGTLTHADGSLIPVEWSLIPLSRHGEKPALYVFRTGTRPLRDGPRPAPAGHLAQQEADRNRRAAAELQHGAQERLVSLLLGLSLARDHLVRDGDRARVTALLDDAVRDAGAALAHVRNVTAATYPGALRLRGLPTALAALAKQYPLPVAVSGNLDGRLPETVELHTYLLVTEAVGRAVHSARASRVRVTADLDADLVVTVVDDGAAPGGPLDAASPAAMADRVSVLGGTLSVSHTRGEGTTVRAAIPLRRRP
ncbi:hypothetical protein GCM10010129_68380 [Streptomyces fumigatiscleroticus]|nr:hypothetical protein GCM10010129_68380 [Streptomyces fumigatiscleroticus]